VLPVDNVVLCAGQEPLRELQAGRWRQRAEGAPDRRRDVAAELDAKRAIKQGTEVAAALIAPSTMYDVTQLESAAWRPRWRVWHEMVAKQRPVRTALDPAPDAVFRSPMAIQAVCERRGRADIGPVHGDAGV
jgi:2,4-dienoyl-CoA reductase (NADPH2)